MNQDSTKVPYGADDGRQYQYSDDCYSNDNTLPPPSRLDATSSSSYSASTATSDSFDEIPNESSSSSSRGCCISSSRYESAQLSIQREDPPEMDCQNEIQYIKSKNQRVRVRDRFRRRFTDPTRLDSSTLWRQNATAEIRLAD
eukprot:CAMPEP_0201650890 /NCGR_PEP_ID=MMETSP0493-20130528/42029_1 /ASSEMBLY_ACC=CAM_ASM_000838 /TAXON_ID=420259 /ORGANISM="Thalassiosira gravida, Strain GMp14c1" /LENGTH=142 /DNA_ID=CAMNT_0048127097 /DNA_START=90 /DNA_END=515 /DNA_ORIENTATION=+